MDKENSDELITIGYFSSLAWLFLQVYRTTIAVLVQNDVIVSGPQSTSMVIVFISLIGFFGVSIISGVFSYKGPVNQRLYWAALCVAEFIGAPISYWNIRISLLWGLIASLIAMALSIYSFRGFLKLRISINGPAGIKNTKNIFNILGGISVVAFLILWRIAYKNIWNS